MCVVDTQGMGLPCAAGVGRGRPRPLSPLVRLWRKACAGRLPLERAAPRPQAVGRRARSAAGTHAGASQRNAGCLFLGHRGQGAYVADLWEESAPLQRIAVVDAPEGNQAAATVRQG